MRFRIPSNRRLAKKLGPDGTAFVVHCANAITRILPHTATDEWSIERNRTPEVTWGDNTRRYLRVTIGPVHGYYISARVQRQSVPIGVGAISRTLDDRERDICQAVVDTFTDTALSLGRDASAALISLKNIFDELVVASYLKAAHDLELDPGQLFRKFRSLAEQTYENKALSFGCIVDGRAQRVPAVEAVFPEDFLERKKYRALSDGYYTVYKVSRSGGLVGFVSLLSTSWSPSGKAFFPEWSRPLALLARQSRIGISLTRHGDLLVLDRGSLRFTYRFGKWQYWNHAHLVDLLHNSARVQRVPKTFVPKVVNAIYRAALDVSFRRSGGSFVLLRNRQNLSDVVLYRGSESDTAIGHLWTRNLTA